MSDFLKIYNLLLQIYGKQNWWPLINKPKSELRYFGKKPKDNSEIFEIIVGAILTQNTSWKNVEKAILNMYKNNLLDRNKIKSEKKEKIAELIKSSGYYNQKAIRLKTVAEFFSDKKIIEIKNENNVDKLREELLEIKGIGKETCDSILLYAFSKPVFVVDAYTRRIFTNLNLIKKDFSYEQIRKAFEKNLPKNPELYKEYHALIVEHAKQYCTKKPKCKGCFLNHLCYFYNPN